jgi:hypothetical protein
MAATTNADPAGTTTSQPGYRPADRGNGVPWLLLFLTASVLAIIFLVFALVVYTRADDTGMTETVWARMVFVLHGIEAIAFTAVGWLFGREIHRGEAKQAKEHAGDAKRNADDARGEAKQARQESAAARDAERGAVERASAAEVAGWRLAEAVRAQGRSRSVDGPVEEGGDENSRISAGTARVEFDHLTEMADTLFPPR